MKPEPIPLSVLNDNSLPRKRRVNTMPPGMIGANYLTRKTEMAVRASLKEVKNFKASK